MLGTDICGIGVLVISFAVDSSLDPARNQRRNELLSQSNLDFLCRACVCFLNFRDDGRMASKFTAVYTC